MTQIAILVPTLGRADALKALIDNIDDATTTPHTTYLVMERDDDESIETAMHLNCVSILGRFGSCSIAINEGYRNSPEPFVAVVNDDVYFHPGWDTAALAHFREGVHVVGMNEGTGDTKCFPMIRRTFIEEHSGVFDKPNTIFHTYKSQGPDTEFAFYAMLRGVWENAYDAVVEHRRINPDQHTKARETIAEDLAEYNRRWPQWDPQQRMPPPVATVVPV